MDFKKFCDSVEIKNPIQVNRKVDGCDYYFKDHYLFHERTEGMKILGVNQTPAQLFHNIFKEPTSVQWTNSCYTDIELAEKDAAQYGGKVIEDFYCDGDNKTWFVGFKDVDKALRFCFDKLGIDKVF